MKKKNDTSKSLNSSVGRRYYQDAAQWLLLLTKIKDNEIKKRDYENLKKTEEIEFVFKQSFLFIYI